MENKIIELMAEILEVDSDCLSMETDYRDKQFDWDSLKGYAVLVMLEEEFDTVISVEEFMETETINDLLKFCLEAGSPAV